MARTHISGPWVTTKGYEQKISGAYKTIVDDAGYLHQLGVKLTDTAATLNLTKSFSETVVFDTIGDAGTYTGDVTLPAGAMLENIVVHNVTVCNQGTTALMDVGDFNIDGTTPIDADGFFAAIDVKTALAANECVDFSRTGDKEGAYLPYDTDMSNAGSQIIARYSATARIIRGVITTDGTTSSTGKQLMTVVYNVPVPVSSVFAATT